MTALTPPSTGPWEMADNWLTRARSTWERARLIYDAEAKLVAVVPEYPGFSSATARARFIAAGPGLARQNAELVAMLRGWLELHGTATSQVATETRAMLDRHAAEAEEWR